MKIIKAVRGRKAQKGQYVVTVLVDEKELNELVPDQFSEMKMAVSPMTSLDKKAPKWLEKWIEASCDMVAVE